jgi:hypothetical protein
MKFQELSKAALIRFWEKVHKSEGCWNWTASKDRRGYGHFSLNGRGAAPVKAHRLSFFVATGVEPGDSDVCHHCDNPACVRPDHLFLGTAKDNAMDASKKGRLKNNGKNCKGAQNPAAKLTDKNVIQIRGMLRLKISKGTIAKLFKVSRKAIQKIQTGESWSHVKEPCQEV